MDIQELDLELLVRIIQNTHGFLISSGIHIFIIVGEIFFVMIL